MSTVIEHPVPRAHELDAHRGSVVILPGRGESPAAYDRLSVVLGWAGYDVVMLAASDVDEATERLRVLAEEDRRYPRVVLGADTGAISALRLVRTPGIAVDAAVLLGLPGPSERGDIDDGPGTVPSLVLHGELDRVSPSLSARALTAKWSHARFITVADTGHDVLHDVHHRSVAVEITQFLETLRVGKHPLRVSIRSTL